MGDSGSDHPRDPERDDQRDSGQLRKQGAVEVSCIRKDFYVDVRVHDTGPGICPEKIGKIFDPYFTTKQGKSGTGLGLYITKKVVEDHTARSKSIASPAWARPLRFVCR